MNFHTFAKNRWFDVLIKGRIEEMWQNDTCLDDACLYRMSSFRFWTSKKTYLQTVLHTTVKVRVDEKCNSLLFTRTVQSFLLTWNGLHGWMTVSREINKSTLMWTFLINVLMVYIWRVVFMFHLSAHSTKQLRQCTVMAYCRQHCLRSQQDN